MTNFVNVLVCAYIFGKKWLIEEMDSFIGSPLDQSQQRICANDAPLSN